MAPATTANDTLLLGAGAVEIAAGDAKKAPRFHMVAYGGGNLHLAAPWFDTVISLNGLRPLPQKVNILVDHDATVNGVAGSGTPEIVDGRELHLKGSLSRATDAGRTVAALAAEGNALQASVGVEPVETEFIRAGETVQVNGRALKAEGRGFTLVTKGVLREVSILPIGADASTSLHVAAKRGSDKETHPMLEIKTVLTPEAESIRIEAAAETDRIAAIRKICASGHAEIEAQAIREGWEPSKAELSVLRADRPKAPAVNTGARGASEADVILAGAYRQMGRSDLAEKVGPAAAEQAERFRHTMDWAEACIRADGLPVPRGAHAMLRAAFSTLSMTTALTESGNRIAREALAAAPPTITLLGNPMDLANFKEVKILTPVLRRGFQQMAPGGQLQHASIEEELQTAVKADTYGEMFTVTLQDVMNDDLGTIPQLVAALTRNGARKLNDVGFSLVLANPSDWFGTDNANLISGATTVLSAEGLRQGIESFRKQVDLDGRPLDVSPAFLVVPPELEETATALLSSVELARYVASGTDRQPTGNPYQGKLVLIVEPRLSNDTFTGYSATAWFLFGPPALGAVNIGYVGGARAPVVEQVELPANVLGIGFRAYWDFAVALGEYRSALKSAGA